MSWFAWVGLYFAAQILVPFRKKCRGLFTRKVLARVVPPCRWWTGFYKDTYRYFLWLGCWALASLFIGEKRDVNDLVFWGTYILLLLDDYFFGDDDSWKKFLEGVKNKVKWKMELPQPVSERGGGGTA